MTYQVKITDPAGRVHLHGSELMPGVGDENDPMDWPTRELAEIVAGYVWADGNQAEILEIQCEQEQSEEPTTCSPTTLTKKRGRRKKESGADLGPSGDFGALFACSEETATPASAT